MSFWLKVRGTIETLFQLGLGGPQWKNDSGAISARDLNDAAFAIVRGATAVAANDLVTLAQQGAIPAPLTRTTRTNSSNATWTFDSTGGGADDLVNHNRTGGSYVTPAPTLGRELILQDLTGAIGTNNVYVCPTTAGQTINGSAGYAMSGTFNVSNGSTTVTASTTQARILAAGMSVLFGDDTVSRVISAFDGTTGITLATAYGGTNNATAAGTRTSITWAANASRLTIYSPDGTNWWVKGDGTPTTVSFAGAGTYTFIPPPGVTQYDAALCGGGGGGEAGTNGTLSTGGAGGNGGGGAQEVFLRAVACTGNSAVTVVVGSGGIGGVGAGTAGGNGGTTTSGSLQAVGGSGGIQVTGAGGSPVATSITVNTNTIVGSAFSNAAQTAYIPPGQGGRSGTGGNGAQGLAGSAGSPAGGGAGGNGGSPGAFPGTAGSGGGGGGGGASTRASGGVGGTGGTGGNPNPGGAGSTPAAPAANSGAGGGGGGGGGVGSITPGAGANGRAGADGYANHTYVL